MKIPLSKRTIWLTGASSGIGFDLAKALAERDNTLILTSRGLGRITELQSRYPDHIHFVQGDIGNPDCVQKLAKEIGQLTSYLDTVILNAGTCEYLDVGAFDIDMIERVTQINYLGFARCVSIALPFIRNSTHHPHLVGVSSAASYLGLPRSEAYGSSKAALRHFLQSLRLDLSPFNIAISIIYPGFVDTPLTQKNDFPMPCLLSSDQAVRKIITGIEKRQLEIAFPKRLIWALKFLSALPASWSLKLCKGMVRTSSPRGNA